MDRTDRPTVRIADFRTAAPDDWSPVDDRVMGGVSRSRMRAGGDGKRYRLRVRTDDRAGGIAYQATFPTRGQDWETIELPWSRFEPTLRGRRPSEAPPLDPAGVRQLGLMIADKQEGPLRLEIAWIGAVSPEARPGSSA